MMFSSRLTVLGATSCSLWSRHSLMSRRERFSRWMRASGYRRMLRMWWVSASAPFLRTVSSCTCLWSRSATMRGCSLNLAISLAWACVRAACLERACSSGSVACIQASASSREGNTFETIGTPVRRILAWNRASPRFVCFLMIVPMAVILLSGCTVLGLCAR